MTKRLPFLLLLLGAALGALGASPRAAAAQVVERPVPFDSVGRVTTLTPALVRRLGLAYPVWAVTGPWTEAQLFDAGGRVTLVVHREDGSLERRALSAEEVAALRAAVIAGVQAGVRRAEDPSQASRSARGAFIRDQLILSALGYAPALAELTNDEKAGVAVYLLATGGAFFTAAAVANDINVTEAQQFLSRDAAFRGFFAARGLANVFGVDPADDEEEQNLLALSGLLGGIGGSVIGFNYAKPLTDGEARSAALASTTLAATVLGVAGTAGLLDNPARGTERAVIASIIAAGVAGYPIGTSVARRATYTLTGGDVRATRLGGFLGAAVGATAASTIWEDSENFDGSDAQRLTSALTLGGWLGGLFLGDRLGARLFDYTENEAFLIELGAIAGGIMGVAIPVLAESDEPVAYMAAGTGGAIVGAIVANRLVRPRRARPHSSSIELPVRVGAGGRRARAEVSVDGAALAAAGVRGQHAILRVTF